jgi:serine/threonine protein kinase/tetratricopeptide (TPR) repeat protein
MRSNLPFDEALSRQLPLPLAKLYVRAHNTKNPTDLHKSSFYLWEASLRLLASVAVASYAERPEPDPALEEALRRLARPALGDWWSLVRRLVPILADAGDAGFAAVRELVLGRSRDDLPLAAELDAAICEALDLEAAPRSRVRPSELFDRLVRYRNREFGHGAVEHRPREFHARMGQALRSGASELLAKLDFLAGRRLIYVEEVRLQKSGHYLVEWHALVGESPKRIESLESPASNAARLPRPEQVYLERNVARSVGEGAQAPVSLVPLRPLIVFDPRLSDVFFLNSRSQGRRCNYLCFTTGDHQDLDELEGEQRSLLARVLGQSVDPAEFARWSEPDEEEEPVEPPAPIIARPLRRVDEFELLSELGRGNMGTVFRAWQPSLGRQVALKVISGVNDEKAKARFRREVRALGRVDHPHLVKIYTSGFDDEVCYYTMELVEGATLVAITESLHSRSSTAAEVDLPAWREALSTACDECRKSEKSLSDHGDELTSTPPPAGVRHSASPPELTAGGPGYVHQVVELVRQVALAAHALHESGVVHRDIKPGNIMVTADGGQAVLMDLGIAQLADDVEGTITRTREFIGTLRYASPEQVLSVGKLDARSDIYSLGATLWELLTLRPIYGATDQTPHAVLMRQITSDDPERIRKHHPGIAGDLEAIVQKCLEKDPARRYRTPQELADDLGRWLRGELVLAQPLTLRYVAGKFVRRHRLPIAAVAAAALLGVAGFAAELHRVRASLRAERESARKLTDANNNLDSALREVEARRAEAVAERNRAEENARLANARAGELRGANAKLQDALADAESRRREAVAERTRAEESFRLARKAVDELFTQVSESKLLNVPGLQPLRRELLQIALAYYQEFLRRQADDPGLRAELAATYQRVGEITALIGSKTDAIAACRSAIEIRQALVRARPNDRLARADLAASYQALATTQIEVGEAEQAEATFRKALDLRRQLAREGPAPAVPTKDDDRNAAALVAEGAREYPGCYEAAVAETLQSLSDLYKAADRTAEARKAAQEALAIRERLGKGFPSVVAYRAALAVAQMQVRLLPDQSGGAEAPKLLAGDFRELFAQVAGNLGEGEDAKDLRGLIFALQPLVTNPELVKMLQEGSFGPKPNPRIEEDLRRALGAVDAFARKNPSLTIARNFSATMNAALGQYYLNTGQSAKAIAPYRTAVSSMEGLTHDHPEVPDYRKETGSFLLALANALADSGEAAEAERTYLRAIVSFESALKARPGDSDTRGQLADAHARLGHVQRDAGRYAEALKTYRAGLGLRQALAEERPGESIHGDEVAWAFYNLGRSYYFANESGPALENLRKSRELCEDNIRRRAENKERRKNLAWALIIEGNALRDSGRPAEALEAYRRAGPLYERLSRDDPDDSGYAGDRVWVVAHLGRCLNTTGRHAEALEGLDQALPACQEVGRKFPADFDVRQARAAVFNQRGHALWSLGRYAPSLESYRKALPMYHELARERPRDLSAQGDLAWIHQNIGEAARDAGRTAEAMEAFYKALALCDDLAQQYPDNLDRARQLAEVLVDVGNAHNTSGRRAEALEAYGRAQPVLEALARKLPAGDRVQPALAWNCYHYAWELVAAGRSREAVAVLDAGVNLCRRQLARSPDDADRRKNLAWLLSKTGRTHRLLGHPDEAIAAYRAAADGFAWLTRHDPANDSYRVDQAETYNFLGGLLAGAGDRAGAVECYRAAGAACLALPLDGSPRRIVAAETAAVSLLDACKPAEADSLLAAALPARRKGPASDPKALANTLSTFGWALTESGRPAQAEPLLREAIDLRRKALPAEHWATANTENLLGDCLRRLGRGGEAEPLLLASTAALRRSGETPPRRLEQAVGRVVAFYESVGRADEAARWRLVQMDAAFPAADPFRH